MEEHVWRVRCEFSFTDVEFEVSVMYPSEAIEQSWIHGFSGQQRSLDWSCISIGGQHIDGAGSGLAHLQRLCKMRKGLGLTGPWVISQ